MKATVASAKSPTSEDRVCYLLIVARRAPDLYNYLTRAFAKEATVRVLLDRRRTERRGRVEPYQPERRRAERRRQPSIDNALSVRGVAMVRKRQGGSPDADTNASPLLDVLAPSCGPP
jgi:hypothetical protein